MTKLKYSHNLQPDVTGFNDCMWSGRTDEPHSLNPSDRLDPSFFLQAVPLPSGQADSTFTLDYESRRFFQFSTSEPLVVRNTYVSVVARLCEVFKNNLSLIPPAPVCGYWELAARREVATDRKAFWSLMAWTPLSHAFYVAPLRLEFSNTHIPTDVLEYCSEERILPYFRVAVLLALQSFTSLRKLDARLQVDPDGDDERVVIDVTVNSGADEVLKAKKEYTRQWMRTTPPEIRDRIRLLYHLG